MTDNCPHYCDNQGLCHRCGILMDEYLWFIHLYGPDKRNWPMNPTLRTALLNSMIEQLQDANRAAKHIGSNLDNIDANFYRKNRKRPIGTMSVTKAMDCMVSDVYLFEDFDLREAVRVELRSN